MRIGILQTGHFLDRSNTELGDYEDLFSAMFASHDLTFQTWNVVDMEFPETPDDADGWLITGSKHGVYDGLPFIARLEEFIRDAYAAAVPMVGICFGHQIIAQALGGRVVKFDQGWAVGATDYDWDGDERRLNAWHQDQVVEKPKEAKRIATSPFCENAALVYPGRAFTIQAHPEFGQDAISALLKARRGVGLIPEDQLDIVEDRLDLTLANSKTTDDIVAFFKNPGSTG